MDATVVLWILLYVFVIAFIPAIVVLLASFLMGLGFLLRDLKYDISKALKKRQLRAVTSLRQDKQLKTREHR